MASLQRGSPPSKTRIFTLSRQGLVVRFGELGGVVLLSGSASLHGAVLTPNLRYDASWSEIHLEAVKEDAPARVQVYGTFRAHLVLLDAARAELHAELDVMRRDAMLLERRRAAAEPCASHTNDHVLHEIHATHVGAASRSSSNHHSSVNHISHASVHAAPTTLPTLPVAHDAREAVKGPRVLVLDACSKRAGVDNEAKVYRSAFHCHGDGLHRSMALCRDLINAAVREDAGSSSVRNGVIYLDLDVRHPMCGSAGSVSAIFVQEPVAQVHGLESFMPFSFFLGESSVTTVSRRRYLDLCAALQQAVWSVASSDRGSWGSVGGCVIRAGALATVELTRDVWTELVSVFDVTHVVLCERGLAMQQLVESVIVGRHVRVRCYCPDLSYGMQYGDDDATDEDNGEEDEEEDERNEFDLSAARLGRRHSMQSKNDRGLLITRTEEGKWASEVASPPTTAAAPPSNDSTHVAQCNLATSQMVRYFMGTPRAPLTPYRGLCSVADVTFADAVTLQPLKPTDIRARSLAAVMWANSMATLADANVAGYLVLLDVGHKYFTFLSPAPGVLPKPYILVSPSIVMPAKYIPPLSSTT